MKQIIYVAILTVALLSFERQQSVAQGADTAAEQEVRQAIRTYRTALLQRDAAALEQIWADDYTFTNGERHTRRLSAWPISNPAQPRSTQLAKLRT
jgi:hypothetical protein